MSRSVTIRDVARRAGVSRQTVSRAINDMGEISPETRRHVLEVARALGYRPNSIARGLKTNRSLTVGLVVPDISNPFFAEVARGATEAAHQADYGVLLSNTDERPDREWAALRTLDAHRVDGLLLVSSRLPEEQLAEAVTSWPPIVLVNRDCPPSPGVGCVVVDDAQAARVAVGHLLDRGHRAIGFVGGHPSSRSSVERWAGYRNTLRLAGIEPKDEWMAPCAPNAEGGRVAACGLLKAHPELTALLAYNDLVALGALQACAALGRRVPEDCALVGWDDIEFAALASPPLTTMRMPKYGIGQAAMGELLALMAEDDVHSRARDEAAERPRPTVTLQAELVVRGST